MPLSTHAEQQSIILFDGDQFMTSSGRWQVEFDFDHSISNSMRPPPLPKPAHEDKSVHDEELVEEATSSKTVHHDHSGFVDASEGFDDKENSMSPRKTQLLDPEEIAEIMWLRGTERQQQSPLDLETHQETLGHLSLPLQELVNMEQPRNGPLISSTSEPSSPCPDPVTDRLPLPRIKHFVKPSTFIEPAGLSLQVRSASEAASATESSNVGKDQSSPDLLAVYKSVITRKSGEESQVLPLPSSPAQSHQRGLSEGPPPDETATPTKVKQNSRASSVPDKRVRWVEDIERRRPTSKPSSPIATAILVQESEPRAKRRKLSNASTVSAASTASTASSKSARSLSATTIARPQLNVRDTKQRSEQDSDTIAVEVTPRRQSKRQTAKPTVSPTNRVIFSTGCDIQTKTKTMSTFAKLGGRVENDFNNANILCVPDRQLKKTLKLILAIVLNKTIVTEKWVVDMQRQNSFPDPAKYLPKDKNKELEWKFSLAAAVKRKNNNALLEDCRVYITPQLTRTMGPSVVEFERIASAMGALGVHRRLPSKKASASKTLVLATEQDDPDAANIGRSGHRMYSKDILTMTALRGKLETDSEEFEIPVPIKEEEA